MSGRKKRGPVVELHERQKSIEIKPLNRKQAEYLRLIERSDITFSEGAAGSGKSFLATLMAMRHLNEGRCDRIIICRPAVTAGGEKIGFLPGRRDEKMEPFVQPLFDAFRLYWSNQTIRDMMAQGQIEIIPLAFMRGRRLRNAFILADEMENATPDNLLMILTRLGEGSRMVITGDPRQSDIHGVRCFEVARRRLSRIDRIRFIRFENSDVVRHPTVARILDCWVETERGRISPSP